MRQWCLSLPRAKRYATICGSRLQREKPLAITESFSTAIDPTRLSTLTQKERAHLAEVGKTQTGVEAAGTYAKQILNRLLIDLSWNSSRLEGQYLLIA